MLFFFDAEIAALTSLLNFSRRNRKNFVQSEKTISRIKSFELKDHFPQLFFCQRSPFFDNSAGIFSLKMQTKQQKGKFSWESHFLESASLEGNTAFLTNFGKYLVEKWQIFSPSFLKKVVLDELKKINFNSKCPLDTYNALWTTLRKPLPKIRKAFTQSPVTIKKQEKFRKISCWILSLKA